MSMLCTELLLVVGAVSSAGATQQSANFVVEAPSARVAKAAAEAAEDYRRELAREWLGDELPRWSSRCRITIHEHADTPPSGRTTFSLIRGGITELRIVIRAPLDAALGDVLPHEICHAVFATHFGRALPRWVDEGAATLAEGEQQKTRQRLLAANFLATHAAMSLNTLIGASEYPNSARRLKAVYLQGFSLVDYLVQRKGKRQFIRFLRHVPDRGWDQALRDSYDIRSVDELERLWRGWARPDEDTPPVKRTKRRWI